MKITYLCQSYPAQKPVFLLFPISGVPSLGPGTLRLLMRVDGGAWLPPPGLPVAHEPTTGDVGILVVGD